MVGRVVYLPRDLDEKLRVTASRTGRTANDIAIKALDRFLGLGEAADGLSADPVISQSG